MTRAGRAVLGAAALAVGLAPGCARHGVLRAEPGDGPAFGVYRGRLTRAAETQKFRLLLWAEAPDRVHGEVLSPIGSTELILEGGGGQLAVTLVREGVSFVGPADAAALERVLGVPLGLGDLVSGLVGEPVSERGIAVQRTGAAGFALPRRLDVRSAEAHLSLDLRRVRRAPAGARLGTGEPPPDTRRRPLHELELAPTEVGFEVAPRGRSG